MQFTMEISKNDSIYSKSMNKKKIYGRAAPAKMLAKMLYHGSPSRWMHFSNAVLKPLM